MSDDDTFARLIYYGVTQLHRQEMEVWLLPVGYLLDQIEIHHKVTGVSQPRVVTTIDDVIPAGI